MDALRRSIAREQAASSRPTKTRKRVVRQAEMLLPIAGKVDKKTTRFIGVTMISPDRPAGDIHQVVEAIVGGSANGQASPSPRGTLNWIIRWTQGSLPIWPER